MDIPSWLIGTATPLGLAILIIGMVGHAIIVGKILPERTHERLMRMAEQERSTLREALARRDEQIRQLATTAETTNALLTSLITISDGEGGEQS